MHYLLVGLKTINFLPRTHFTPTSLEAAVRAGELLQDGGQQISNLQNAREHDLQI